MAKGWGDTKANSDIKWIDKVEWFKFQGSDFNQLRLLGPIMSASQHWVEITKTDGSKTKFPMTCSGYNPEDETVDPTKCPACQANIPLNKFYFQNAIVRDLQETKPAKIKAIEDYPDELSAEFRTKDTQHWSPIKVVRIPVSCAAQLRDIVKLNKHRVKEGIISVDISDPDYGCDIFIKYDKDESPSSMYNVQKGETSPLTDEEKTYKLFDLHIVTTDVVNDRKSLVRLRYLPAEKDKTEMKKNLTAYDKEEDLPDPDAFEEEGDDVPAPQDQFTSMTRQELKIFIKKNSLSIKVYKTTLDDDLRQMIRDEYRPSCYGTAPDSTDDCFECHCRIACLDKTEKN